MINTPAPPDQRHPDPLRITAAPRDDNLTADAFRGQTVCAYAGGAQGVFRFREN